MKLYLSPELQAHRRGRFLASLLEISQSSELGLPNTGLILMTGEALQASEQSQKEIKTWARQPGCSLLLLPPYREGSVFDFLDWRVEVATTSSGDASQVRLVNILAGELAYKLHGVDGACAENTASGDPICHTRYWKAHSNSGLLAATILPLWSISLLDQTALVRSFLASIESQCGLPSTSVNEIEHQKSDVVRPEDITVLVCCYGFNVVTAEDLMNELNTYAVPFLNLANFDLTESVIRLRNAGIIDDTGTTEKGLVYLMESKYWAFAESLRNEG